MNQKYIIVNNSLENYIVDGKKAGYQFRIRVPYYMGVPFSQIEHIRVKTDLEAVPSETIRIVASTGEEFTLEEIKTVYTYFWEYGEKLLVRVYQDGGIENGKHRIDADVAVDVIYAPKGFGTCAFQYFTI